MNRVIWKWTIERGSPREFALAMPEDPEIMACQAQDGEIVLWALVKKNRRQVNVEFQIVDTGVDADGLLGWTYVSTFQIPAGESDSAERYAGHLFVKGQRLLGRKQ